MTHAEFIEIVQLVCPHCRRGSRPTKHLQEWQHQLTARKGDATLVSVVYCVATLLLAAQARLVDDDQS